MFLRAHSSNKSPKGNLTSLGTGLPVAVAITLITRLFTLGIGFPLGFAAILWAKLGAYIHYDGTS